MIIFSGFITLLITQIICFIAFKKINKLTIYRDGKL